MSLRFEVPGGSQRVQSHASQPANPSNVELDKSITPSQLPNFPRDSAFFIALQIYSFTRLIKSIFVGTRSPAAMSEFQLKSVRRQPSRQLEDLDSIPSNFIPPISLVPRCNNLQCRRVVSSRAVATTCSRASCYYPFGTLHSRTATSTVSSLPLQTSFASIAQRQFSVKLSFVRLAKYEERTEPLSSCSNAADRRVFLGSIETGPRQIKPDLAHRTRRHRVHGSQSFRRLQVKCARGAEAGDYTGHCKSRSFLLDVGCQVDVSLSNLYFTFQPNFRSVSLLQCLRYQQTQEYAYLQITYRQLEEKANETDRRLAGVVRDANQEINELREKIAAYEKEFEQEKRRSIDVAEQLQEKTRQLNRLQVGFRTASLLSVSNMVTEIIRNHFLLPCQPESIRRSQAQDFAPATKLSSRRTFPPAQPNRRLDEQPKHARRRQHRYAHGPSAPAAAAATTSSSRSSQIGIASGNGSGPAATTRRRTGFVQVQCDSSWTSSCVAWGKVPWWLCWWSEWW